MNPKPNITNFAAAIDLSKLQAMRSETEESRELPISFTKYIFFFVVPSFFLCYIKMEVCFYVPMDYECTCVTVWAMNW